MTVLEDMKKLIEDGDTEGAHIKADELLCVVLRAHHEDELVDAYEQVPKWYA